MSYLKKSLGLSFATQYTEMAIQFIGVMFLARLITPEEIGIYSVAAFLMAMLHVFRDFGVGKYLIAVEELTPERIRSAYGVAIILAGAIALLLYSSAPLVADFYHEPRVADILVVMSASFALTPLGGLLTAIFRRNMEFKKILIVRVTSSVCHVITAVTLAIQDFGALSLAWANFAGILSFGIAAMILRTKGTPFIPSFKKMREILSFGSINSLGNLVGVLGTNGPDVIIGKVISLAASGYFSRANGMVQMFRTLVNGAIVPLVLPYFSQLRREKGDISQAYRSAVEYLSVFAWPFFTVIGLLALPIIRVLYGLQWDASVPVVQVLCVAGAITSLTTFAADVMIAHGKVGQATVSQVLTQPVRIGAILLASPFGLVAIAAALVLAECYTAAIISRRLHAATGIGLRGVLRSTFKSALVTLCSAAGPALVMWAFMNSEHAWLELVVGGLSALIGWLIGIVWTRHPVRIHLYQAHQWVATRVRG
ncbi:lipopolysaccharide biosynthesis protein [Telluria aromaticivorans]|uniref:Lipopolysaccharide biosynthesis protein n=1 Tax=Telluria aromaticivorans TaxID=2725995 RepID=A0A7Y2K040_9BURK|nr:lipopolysaccharide biosynthesis protein [Telluria aromaticivorans]NNG24212.1 lipopolysaccharide biosynthesis protein [Telluria aromaticivorans]